MLAGVRVTLVHLLVAQGPRPATRTVAQEAGHVVLARAPRARVVPALVHVRLASLAVPAGLTAAAVVVHGVRALAVVHAGVAGALVHVLLAQPAPVAWLAVAPVRVDPVDTFSLVEAGVGGALVDVDLAVVAVGAGLAVALVAVTVASLLARAVVLAG